MMRVYISLLAAGLSFFALTQAYTNTDGVWAMVFLALTVICGLWCSLEVEAHSMEQARARRASMRNHPTAAGRVRR